LCSRHHRLHHRGELGIAGNADDPDGIRFSDGRGRPLAPCGRPAPPTEPPPTGNWTHPTGERLYLTWVQFRKPPNAKPDPEPEPLGDCINLDDPIFDGQRDDVVYSG
jgi:hypothetical protein